MYIQAINKVKVTHQGQDQIEVIFKKRYSYAGGLHLNQMRSCLLYFQIQELHQVPQVYPLLQKRAQFWTKERLKGVHVLL